MGKIGKIIAFAAIGAAIGWAAGFTIGSLTALQSALVSFTLQVAVGLINSALAPDLTPFDQLASSRAQTVRQPLTSHRILIGDVKVSGPLTYIEHIETSRSINGSGFFVDALSAKIEHLVIVLGSGEITKIGAIYLNDNPIYDEMLDSDGMVTEGQYKERIRIHKYLGSPNQSSPSYLNGASRKWTDEHRGRGVAYLHIEIAFDPEAFPTGIPNISAEVKGIKFYDPRSFALAYNPNPVLAVRHYLMDGIYGMNADFSEIDDITADANICEEFVTTLDVVHEVYSVDTTLNLLKIRSDITPDSSTGFGGEETDGERLKFITGDRVQLTTTGTLPSPLATLTNYYVIVHWREKWTRPMAIKLATTYKNALDGVGIDLTTTGSGQHTITKNAEPRYTCHGVIDSAQSPQTILEGLLSSMAGRLTYAAGLWKIFAGAYRTPTLSISEDEIIEDLVVTTKTSRRERINSITGTYLSPVTHDQPTSYPPPKLNAVYVNQDGGEEIIGHLDLPFTNRPQTAQRIANIELERNRREIIVQAVGKLHFYQFQPSDTLQLNNTRFGFTNKVFEVIEVEFLMREDSEGNPFIAIGLLLKEADSSIYTFDPNSQETPVDPKKTDLPSPFDFDQPRNIILASGTNVLLVTETGTIISRIKASWDDPSNPFVVGHEIQYKKSSETDWGNAPNPTSLTTAFIFPVQDLVNYDVRIRAINVFGSKSVWTPSYNHKVIGKSAPPVWPSEFVAETLSNNVILFKWTDEPGDPDVNTGGGYKIRGLLTSTINPAWSSMTAIHDGVLTGRQFESALENLANGTWVFAIRSVDSSGNESTSQNYISDFVLDRKLDKDSLFYQNERVVGWPGTKTDCYADIDGALNANPHATNGEWQDLPTQWKNLHDQWHGIAECVTTITYETLTIDLGADMDFYPLVELETEATINSVQMQTGSSTDGAPTGSFVDLAVVKQKRYFKVKISIGSKLKGGTNRRASVQGMIIKLKEAGLVQTFDDVSVSSDSYEYLERVAAGHFYIGVRSPEVGQAQLDNFPINFLTQARITALQNVGSGWTWELISKSISLGVEKVLNGDFPTNLTNWTDVSSGTGSISWATGGTIACDGGASGVGGARQERTSVLKVGRFYRFSFDVIDNSIQMHAGHLIGASSEDENIWGLQTVQPGTDNFWIFQALDPDFYIEFWNSNNNVSKIDNISLRQYFGVGAEFKTYNSSGTLADATVDIELRGGKL